MLMRKLVLHFVPSGHEYIDYFVVISIVVWISNYIFPVMLALYLMVSETYYAQLCWHNRPGPTNGDGAVAIVRILLN